MRVSRLWRDLKNRKWFGFGHDMESQPRLGDLALFCPSCPQPGINMPLHWEEKYARQVNQYYLLCGTHTLGAGRYTWQLTYLVCRPGQIDHIESWPVLHLRAVQVPWLAV
jgi:hypothetical protein